MTSFSDDLASRCHDDLPINNSKYVIIINKCNLIFLLRNHHLLRDTHEQCCFRENGNDPSLPAQKIPYADFYIYPNYI